MRNTLLLTIIFLVLSITTRAQDIIYPKRGTTIPGHIIEVSNRDLKFYKAGDPDSVINNMPKALIDSIVYENGVREIMSRHRNVPRALEPRRPKPMSHEDIINNPLKISAGAYYLDNPETARNADDLNNRMILGSYVSLEKVFAQNKLGAKLMPFIGMNRMAYGTAIGLTVYPRPYYNVVFHMGPRLLFYRTKAAYNDYNPADQVTTRIVYPANFIAFMFDAGVDIRINKNWSIDTGLGIGRLVYKTKRPDGYDPHPIKDAYIFENVMANAKLGLTYKF